MSEPIRADHCIVALSARAMRRTTLGSSMGAGHVLCAATRRPASPSDFVNTPLSEMVRLRALVKESCEGAIEEVRRL